MGTEVPHSIPLTVARAVACAVVSFARLGKPKTFTVVKAQRVYTIEYKMNAIETQAVARPRTTRKIVPTTTPNQRAPAGATDRIVDSITPATIERRLLPGNQLSEQTLADRFVVSCAMRPWPSHADVVGRTRLFGGVHAVLARMLGKEVLAKLLVDLLSREPPRIRGARSLRVCLLRLD